MTSNFWQLLLNWKQDLKNFLRGWFLALGLKKGLVECATFSVKSEVILNDSTYYKTLLQLSTFGYHCGEGKCMLVLWLHKMFPHETKGWIYWVTQLELGLTTFTIIISYCLIWHFIWSNGKYLREKLYQKEKSKLHKLFSWCAFFSFCL